MKEIMCKLAVNILQKYKKSVILNYQIRGNIRPIYNNPIISNHHIIGKSFIRNTGMEFKDYRQHVRYVRKYKINISKGVCDYCLCESKGKLKVGKNLIQLNHKTLQFCDEHLLEVYKRIGEFIEEEINHTCQ